MAQPTPYERQDSFTDHSTEFPSTPQPGVSLDAEFDAIKLTTDEIRTNLALIQRDDGKLADGVVTVDAVSAELLDQIGDAAAGPFATAAAASAAASAASAAAASASANAANDDAATAGAAKTDAVAAEVAAEAAQAAAEASAAAASATAATVAAIDDAVADDAPTAGAVTRSAAKIGALIDAKTAPRPEDFGAVGDGVTDDAVALQAWLDTGGDLFLPAEHYYSSVGLIVRKQVHVRGAGYGFDARIVGYQNMPGSRIRFGAGVRGFDVQPQTTLTDIATVLADTGAAFTQEGAYGSTFEDFALIGPNAGAATHGFYARTVVHLENVHVYQFEGEGIFLMGTADIPSVGDEYGNPSTSTLTNTVALENGSHGLHIRGRDANSCKVTGHNSRSNGGWGILEEGLLGNHYDQPHIAGNTLGAIKAVGAVSNSQISHPYIEGDAFSGCEINGENVIIGSDLSAINSPTAQPPTTVAPDESHFNKIRFVWSYDLGAIGGDYCRAYRHANFGLVLQGKPDGGGACDVAILNKNGSVAFYNPSGTQNFICNGTMQATGSATVGGVDPTLNLNGSADTIGSQILMSAFGASKFQVYASAGSVYMSADTLIIRDKTTLVDTRLTIDTNGLNLGAGKVVKVNGTQVVGAQGAAVADAVAAVAAPTKAEFDALVAQFNALLARARAHGLIAP